jgi:hypothetical protein
MSDIGCAVILKNNLSQMGYSLIAISIGILGVSTMIIFGIREIKIKSKLIFISTVTLIMVAFIFVGIHLIKM